MNRKSNLDLFFFYWLFGLFIFVMFAYFFFVGFEIQGKTLFELLT